jgi:hypothetical protein
MLDCAHFLVRRGRPRAAVRATRRSASCSSSLRRRPGSTKKPGDGEKPRSIRTNPRPSSSHRGVSSTAHARHCARSAARSRIGWTTLCACSVPPSITRASRTLHVREPVHRIHRDDRSARSATHARASDRERSQSAASRCRRCNDIRRCRARRGRSGCRSRAHRLPGRHAGFVAHARGLVVRVLREFVGDIIPKGPSELAARGRLAISGVRQSPDAKEGIAAFKEKRKPKFTSR